MERIVRWVAYLANLVLVGVAFVMMSQVYYLGQKLAVALLLVPPVLSLILIYTGPDREERALRREVAKARLRRELKDLEAA